jgi:hypothetical protein
METEQIKSAADRMKDDKKLPADSKFAKAVEQAKGAARSAVGDVKDTVKSTKSAKIAQGDEGRSANGE